MSDALLMPGSIALVGASDDASKTSSRPLRYLRAGGYDGTVYPIARRPTVNDERAWPSLDALPERPDHAFILLGTDAAIEAVADCARLGIPAVTVLAGGFGDAGPSGAAKEARMRASLAGSGTRLLGPNSMGLVNLHRRITLTANAAFAEADLPRGGLFVASQSGSMIGALASRGKSRGIGFATLVSVGAEADLSVGQVCERALDDPDVTVFILFLETIRDAVGLRRFAAAAHDRNKPVLAYKLGRSQAGAELARSHTGALAGEDDVADAFLQDCGIARVHTFEALLEAPALLRRLPARTAKGRPVVGIVTTTGGGAAMVVDQLGLRGIDVQGPGPATTGLLNQAGIVHEHGRILDLTLAGTRYDVMKAALDALRADPCYSLVVAVVGSSARFQPELAVAPILDTDAASQGTAAPLAAFLVPEAPDALHRLAAAGIPAFRTPEACADAIAAALCRRPPRVIAPAGWPMTPGRLLDELAAYALLARLGIATAPAVELGQILPPFPVAAKILSDQIAHKSDCGGVVLNIPDAAALETAARAIRANVARAQLGLDTCRILVQQMVHGVGEALVGYRVDPQVGPVIVLAAGGIATEVYRDRSVRPAPVTLDMAHEMIAGIAGFALLRGFRNRPRGDLDALAQAVVALSTLAGDSSVVECEINPLMVLPEGQGVVAVDAVASVTA